MKYVITFVVLIMLASISPAKAEVDTVYKRIVDSGKLRCGYTEWPPFFNSDPNTKELSGFFYELWQKIGEKLDVEIEWTMSISWGQVIPAIKGNKFDVFCNGVWPNPGRRKNLLLSRAQFYQTAYFFVREGDTRFDNNYAAINKKNITVVGQDGDVTESFFVENYPLAKTAHITSGDDWTKMLMNVATGKGDIFLADYPYVKEFMDSNPGKLRIVTGAPALITPTVIPFFPGEHQLKAMIDSALTDMINDGTIEKLISKSGAEDTFSPLPEVEVKSRMKDK